MNKYSSPTPSLGGFIFLLCIIFLALYLMSCGNGGGNNNSKPTPPPTASISVMDDVAAIQGFNPTDIQDKIPVWQAQLNEIAAAWGPAYKCSVHENGSGDYTMLFTNAKPSDCGPACHSTDSNNNPVGYVSPAEGIASGNDPLLEAGHEIDEMCVDPFITHTSNGALVEIVDPVVCWTYCEGDPVIPGMLECGENGSVNNGNIVPDFVFPSYYDPKGLPPYDFMHLLKTPRSHC